MKSLTFNKFTKIAASPAAGLYALSLIVTPAIITATPIVSATPAAAKDGENSGRGRGRGGDDDQHHSSGHHSYNGGDRRSLDDSGFRGYRKAKRDRPEIELKLSRAELASVLDGSMVLVDDLGRHLEVEIEIEHGNRVVTAMPHGGDARRNPGAIRSVTLRPSLSRPVPSNDDGTPDQGRGDR